MNKPALNKQYYQRKVGDWNINIMWVYRELKNGYIVNVTGPGGVQEWSKSIFGTMAQALNFARDIVNRKRDEWLDGDKCLNQILNDVFFTIEKEIELDGEQL